MSPAHRFVRGLSNPEPLKFATGWRFLLALAFILSAALSARAQGSTGSTSTLNPGASLQPIEGQALNEGQSALQGVRVTLTNFKGVGRSVAVTDYRGVFNFPNLPIGQYTLTFSHPDYKEQNQQVELFQGGQRDMRILMVRRGPENALPRAPIAAWALQIPGPAQKKYSQGLEALQKNRVRESIGHFQAAIQLYPRFAAAHAALGSAQLSQGDNKAAAAAFEKALEIDTNLPGACLGLGTLYTFEQRFAEAEIQLLRARMLKPEDWRVHHELGEIYWRMGDWRKAEESLGRAVELHTEFARLHLLLMNVLALQEKYPEALAEMEKFLRMFPQDSFAPQVRQKRDLLKAQIEKTATFEPVKKP